MFSRSELAKCREASITSCDISSLVDLRDITIDTTKSVSDRIDSFLEQVHNPYLFKVDDVVIKVNYGQDRPFSAALAAVLQLG